MTLKLTTWTFDTCTCMVEFIWDNAEPETFRSHTLSRIINRCPEHQQIANDIQLFDALMVENKRKNDCQTLVATARQIGTNQVEWHYDQNRLLHIVIAGLSAQAKATLQALVNTNFGAGKVIID